jgi:hypothetical protein
MDSDTARQARIGLIGLSSLAPVKAEAIHSRGTCGGQKSLNPRAPRSLSGCRSSRRKPTAWVQQQAGHRTQSHQFVAAMAAPIVGENRSGARLAAAAFSASRRRSSSSLRRLNPAGLGSLTWKGSKVRPHYRPPTKIKHFECFRPEAPMARSCLGVDKPFTGQSPAGARNLHPATFQSRDVRFGVVMANGLGIR